ncbi:MAG: hypothetical protein KC933_31060 [Myxococcales bacterium]|nr:hypothetical protein [Myxococcales bacterium]
MSGQELAALAVVALAVLYMTRRLTGWPRLRPAAPPEQTPDPVRLSGRLARGLKKANQGRTNDRGDP